MLEQARRVKYCHGEINGPFDNAGISMGAFMGACRKEQLVLGCIPKAPQISDLIQLPLWVPSRKCNVQQKMARSPPWFSPPCVSGISEEFPSALLWFYFPLCLPHIGRNYFWELNVDTDFYVVVSVIAAMFLLLLTVWWKCLTLQPRSSCMKVIVAFHVCLSKKKKEIWFLFVCIWFCGHIILSRFSLKPFVF